MTWILLDVAIALLALGVLAGVGFRLFGRVKALARVVSAATEQVGTATARLADLQAQRPSGPHASGQTSRPGR